MYDFHIHTKYSGCCRSKGIYDLIDAYNTAIERGYEGIGVSDHCNFKSYRYPGIFLETQRSLIQEHNLDNKLLLGLEISIVDRKGNLGVHPKYLKKVDYYIISEHCHLSKLFSDFYRLKDKFVNYVAEGNSNKCQKSVDFLTDLMRNGINKNPKSILAHIWRFTRGRSYFAPYTLEKSESIFEAMQNKNVALELHSGLISQLMMTDEENQQAYERNQEKVHKSLQPEMLTPREYVSELFKIAKKYDLHYSVGSDAHRIVDIGRVGKNNTAEELQSYIKSIRIPQSKIVDPEFFKI